VRTDIATTNTEQQD